MSEPVGVAASGASTDSFDELLSEAARAPSIPLTDPRLGRMLGPYRLSARLGSGAMGVVYRARDVRLERDVALKVLPPSSETVREARFAARARHPNIARIYDVGHDEGSGWIAFELVEGRALADVLEAGELVGADARRLAQGLASALQHLHERGLVHGDVSPRNVLWRDGAPVLVDFGLTSDFGFALAAGTRGFVAPEVSRGAPRDSRSDVYAFGALLRQLPRCPARLRRLADRCCASDPEARPRDGSALVRALSPLRVRRWLALGLTAASVAILALVARSAITPSTTVPPPLADAPSAPERLTYNTEAGPRDAVVSPDGERVALVEGDAVFVLRLADDRRRRLALPDAAGRPDALSWTGADRLLVSARGGAYEVSLGGDARRVELPSGLARASLEGGSVAVGVGDGTLRVGALGAPLETIEAPGRPVGLAWSPNGASLAILTAESDESASLRIYDRATSETRVLTSDSRLVADSGLAGVAFASDDELVLVLASVPAEERSAELVRSPIDAWSPTRVCALPRGGAMLSVDRQRRVVLSEAAPQSDTVVAAWDGDAIGEVRRLSRSSRDDRPTSWTEAEGLLGMMRTGARHRIVHIPLEGGHPQPVGPAGWWTWPQQTEAGLVAFRPHLETHEVTLELVTQGASARVLSRQHERLGDEGAGRAVPRRSSFDCAPDGRCLLVEWGDRTRLSAVDARTGSVSPLAELPGLTRAHDVAVDRAFEHAAIATEGALVFFDLQAGVERGRLAAGSALAQYLAADPHGEGWFATALADASPRFRLLYVSPGEPPRLLHGSDSAWLAHPTPSPGGDQLAFSVMQLGADLYRVALD